MSDAKEEKTMLDFMMTTMAMRFRFNEGSELWRLELGYDPMW